MQSLGFFLLMFLGGIAVAVQPSINGRHAATAEGALTLEDYWVRRSSRAWFDRAGLDALEPAASAMAEVLGWSAAEAGRQVEHCRQIERTSRAPLTRAAGG